MNKDLFELLLATPELTAFDGGDGGNGGDGGDGGTGDGGTGEGNNGTGDGQQGSQTGQQQQQKEKTFTQKDVDEIVVKRNKKVKGQLEQMERNYQKLLQEQSMSAEMRAQLEKDLDEVRGQLMSKEERLKEEKKKAQEEYEAKLAQVEEERDTYRERFESSTINRAISDAQQKHKGYNPDQFIALLGPKAKIVKEVDNKGQETGNLVPRIQWNVNQEDGTVEQVLLSPEEAVEKMKDNLDAYGNMFKPNIAPGVGGGTAPGVQTAISGNIDHKKMTDEEYFELRKKDPEGFRRQVGLTR